MTDKKFQEGLKKIIAYEEKVYAEFSQIIKPYNKELEKQNCEIFCCLMWLYCYRKRVGKIFTKTEDCEIVTKTERCDFNKQDDYMCDIVLCFQPIGANYYDCDADEDQGFQITHTITQYGVSFFKGLGFFTCRTDKLKKALHQDFEKVQSLGLERAIKEILHKNHK